MQNICQLKNGYQNNKVQKIHLFKRKKFMRGGSEDDNRDARKKEKNHNCLLLCLFIRNFVSI